MSKDTSEDGSNLTNKYNPQERSRQDPAPLVCSNLTNKYNPQERMGGGENGHVGSNLTNKYNPQEPTTPFKKVHIVQILPINTILKNV